MAIIKNIPGQLKTFQLLYWALAVSQLVMGVASYVLITTGMMGAPDYDLAMTFQKIALMFIPGSMALGYFIFRYLLSRLDPKLPLEEKVKRYFSFVLVRGALFEAGFLFCCVSALVTNVQLFLWIAPVIFFVFLLLRPTPEAMTSDMQLTPAETNKLSLR